MIPTPAPLTRGTGSAAEIWRSDFPALDQQIHGHPLAYLDSAASAQKPQAVIEAVARFYRHDYANVHRGVHTLSQRATQAYEQARETTRRFLGASRSEEIVFVRGATEAINLVAQSFVCPRLGVDDEVVISAMEHHANIVPWFRICQDRGAHLRVIPIDDTGVLDLEAAKALLGDRTRMLALSHASNVLGTVNPVATLIDHARQLGIPTLIDGAQAAPHGPVDVAALGCDFYTVSGHKLFGPSGIGVLYGRHALLADMPPYQGGGDMIRSVRFDSIEYADPPQRFEAGTPNIAGAVGLAAAIEYIEAAGWPAIQAHEDQLLAHLNGALGDVPGLRLIGTAPHKVPVVSFVLEGIHAHDLGTILDQDGVAIRVGHHCAEPLMARFGVAATARASLALYNQRHDVDRLVAGVRAAQEIFRR